MSHLRNAAIIIEQALFYTDLSPMNVLEIILKKQQKFCFGFWRIL